MFNVKGVVPGKYIDHHVQQEASDVFSKAEKKRDLVFLGAQTGTRKAELMEMSGADPGARVTAAKLEAGTNVRSALSYGLVRARANGSGGRTRYDACDCPRMRSHVRPTFCG